MMLNPSTDPKIVPLRRHEGIPPLSWMSAVLQRGPLLDDERRYVPATVAALNLTHGSAGEAHVVSLDVGNDALKCAVMNRAGSLVITRVPTTYQALGTARYSQGYVSFQMGSLAHPVGPQFRIDVPDGESLPHGRTDERLAEPRYQSFVWAGIVQALMNAGWKPGAFTVILGAGVRNEEIVDQGGHQKVIDPVATALRSLKGEHHVMTTEGETQSEWTLTIPNTGLYAAAQTLGTYFAWGRTLTGRPAQTDVNRIAILDFGGGDTHLLEVNIDGTRLSVSGDRLGDGTVEVARALIGLVKDRYSLDLTTAESQAALISERIGLYGKQVPIPELTAAARTASMDSMLGRVHRVLADRRRYLIHGGGGSTLLLREIEARMAIAHREMGQYLILPPALASESNALGLWAFAYLQAKAAMTVR